MTLRGLGPFVCLIGIIVSVYTLLGLELFAYKSKINQVTNLVDPVNGTSPNFNFDTFFDSFTVVFLILINDI